MTLILPVLTVIDRSVPYAFSHVDIPIPDDSVQPATAHLDQQQIQRMVAVSSEEPARPPIKKFVQVDVGARFIAAPGDPSPFVWRDPGASDCGTLFGPAAVYCAVMSRR